MNNSSYTDRPTLIDNMGYERSSSALRGNQSDIIRLHTFLPLCGYEADLLALLQCLEPINLNGFEVHKKISATVIRSDESIAFIIIEPLHCSSRFFTHSLHPGR